MPTALLIYSRKKGKGYHFSSESPQELQAASLQLISILTNRTGHSIQRCLLITSHHGKLYHVYIQVEDDENGVAKYAIHWTPASGSDSIPEGYEDVCAINLVKVTGKESLFNRRTSLLITLSVFLVVITGMMAYRHFEVSGWNHERKQLKDDLEESINEADNNSTRHLKLLKDITGFANLIPAETGTGDVEESEKIITDLKDYEDKLDDDSESPAIANKIGYLINPYKKSVDTAELIDPMYDILHLLSDEFDLTLKDKDDLDQKSLVDLKDEFARKINENTTDE